MKRRDLFFLGISLVLLVLVFFVVQFTDFKVTGNIIINSEIAEGNDIGGTSSSIAIDSNDKIHIAHRAPPTTSVRYCNNTQGSWSCLLADSANGADISIAIDSNNKIHMSHHDASTSDLKYCNNTQGSWSCASIETANSVGWHTSIAIDSNDNVHISHYDNTNFDLRYCNNTQGSWSCAAIDTGGDVGWYSSIAIDSNDNVHISHHDNTNGNLKYANNTPGSGCALGSWSCVTVDSASANMGEDSSIAIDSNDKVHISHYDTTNQDLRYCNNTKGSWSCATRDSTGTVGEESTIAIDSNDEIHISHYDNTNDDLKYCNNVGGSWSCSKLEDAGASFTRGDRSSAIKKGVIATSTSFSKALHISWFNNSDATNTSVIHTSVDVFYPKIIFSSPTTTAGNLSQNYIKVNITADDENLDLITIYLYNPTSLVNSTTNSNSPFFVNFTNLLDGTYYINATVNDTDGRENSTETKTILLDTSISINFVSPTMATGNYSQSYIEANVTSQNVDLSTINLTLYNSTDLIQSNTSTSSPLFINFTNLNDGIYYLNSTVNDTLNNLNQTETRNILLDTTAPTIIFSCDAELVRVGDLITCNCAATDSGVGVNTTNYTEHPSTATVGTFSTSCVATDYLDQNTTAIFSYTVDPVPATDDTGSDGGGSSEGSPTLTKTSLLVNVNPGEEITITTFENTGIKEITIQVNQQVQNIRIKVSRYDSKPIEITKEVPGKNYRYLQISTENLNEVLEKATVKFEVEKTWVSNNGLNKEEIIVTKFDGETERWNELETIFDSEDDNFYYYTVELDSFSFFAIGEKLSLVEQITSEIIESYDEASETLFGLIVWWILVAIFLVSIALISLITVGLIRKNPEEVLEPAEENQNI